MWPSHVSSRLANLRAILESAGVIVSNSMMPDTELLLRYSEEHSEEAFTELVRRHVNFVYSVALRRLGGDAHRAEDVAQTVFTDLARKARSLSPKVRLAGWLYRSAHFAAAKAARTEYRRQQRETKAQTMQEIMSDSSPDSEWGRLRPVLDEAMQKLSEDDREAIVLRIFEGLTFEAVGEQLAISDTAARKRVDRALEKLQFQLRKQGITSTGAALYLVLSNQAVVAAPAGLAASITGLALTAAASTGVTAFGLFQIMSTNKLAAALAGIILGAALGTTTYQVHAKREAEAALAAAKNENLALSLRVRELEQSPQKIQQTAPAAEDELSTAPLTETQTNKQRNEARRAAKKSGVLTTPPKDAIATDPAIAAVTQQKNKVLKHYGGIFNELQLTKPERDHLTQLLIDKEQASIDFAAANAQQGEDVSQDPETFQAMVASTRETINGQIQALLGDDRYKQFQASETKQGQSALFVRLENRLAPFNAALSPEQTTQLQAVLQGLDIGHVNDQVVAQAGAFLSPQQLGALQEINEKRQAGAKKPKVQQAISQNLPASTK
jgi:RNA polymerase sigma factor (sigma-70 family)